MLPDEIKDARTVLLSGAMVGLMCKDRSLAPSSAAFDHVVTWNRAATLYATLPDSLSRQSALSSPG
jgi:hypothetical protein